MTDATLPSPVPEIPSQPGGCIVPGPGDLRVRMDLVLAEVKADPGLRAALIAEPVTTLKRLGFDLWTSRYVANEWGIGPSSDCAHDTCRLTDPCGWTVCGKTTNSCVVGEDHLRKQMNDLLVRVGNDPAFRRELINSPEKTLVAAGLAPWSAQHVANEWGIGPAGDCGHDTCRLTDPCGWTVCGKTTNSCLGGSSSA